MKIKAKPSSGYLGVLVIYHQYTELVRAPSVTVLSMGHGVLVCAPDCEVLVDLTTCNGSEFNDEEEKYPQVINFGLRPAKIWYTEVHSFLLSAFRNGVSP